LKDLSRRPHSIKTKVSKEIEETILDLRLKTFGTSRIRFRLKRLGVSLSSRTIYKTLKKHTLNVLNCKVKNNRKYKRFAMRHPNDMVQIDILGPFYVRCSSTRNYIISCIDYCSRKVASKWSERKRSIVVLNVLEGGLWITESPKRLCTIMENSLHLEYSNIFLNTII
jgi:hypothetical protein